MWIDLLTNPVLIAVVVLLILAMLRMNVVFAIIIAALCGGLWGGLKVYLTSKGYCGMLALLQESSSVLQKNF